MIVVLDYGMGNLRSVSKALEHLGAEVKVSSNPRDLEKAKKLVLPGVGAFGDAASELKTLKLFDPIRDYLKNQRPFLGICLGLQLLFAQSEESPEAEGLGIYPGTVKAFRSKSVKIPHMGWNQVAFQKAHPFFEGVKDKNYFYFVHSFYAAPEDSSLTAGSCDYGEESFTAILADNHVFATQFHPEKSQEAGLKILKNFLEMA